MNELEEAIDKKDVERMVYLAERMLNIQLDHKTAPDSLFNSLTDSTSTPEGYIKSVSWFFSNFINIIIIYIRSLAIYINYNSRLL